MGPSGQLQVRPAELGGPPAAEQAALWGERAPGPGAGGALACAVSSALTARPPCGAQPALGAAALDMVLHMPEL